VDIERKALHSEEMILLTQVIRQRARAHRLRREDAQDFEQSVHVRLLQRNYDVFERFSGHSSLRTYLVSVVDRLLLDWRNRTYGKWRPSAAAARLGALAIDIERLVHRDQLPLSDALNVMTVRPDAPPRAALATLAAQLPARHQRRPIHLDAIADVAAAAFADPIEIAEQQAADRRRWRTVVEAMRRLEPHDRALVRARYVDGHSLKSLADRTGSTAPQLYRQLARAMRCLRRARSRSAETGAFSSRRRTTAENRASSRGVS
jgi:RNA polymerase sigma factor (sigma-70 family)